ncbi:MAG: hypothetical protein KKH98_10620 [Spirochaetes bacterium]|nr:hypothetical protein [Spirochaetota bacterium]
MIFFKKKKELTPEDLDKKVIDIQITKNDFLELEQLQWEKSIRLDEYVSKLEEQTDNEIIEILEMIKSLKVV